jgi:hypothetical protein
MKQMNEYKLVESLGEILLLLLLLSREWIWSLRRRRTTDSLIHHFGLTLLLAAGRLVRKLTT